MSTRGPSEAPYIIICSGRIDQLAAEGKTASQIKAASDAARNLVVYFGERVTIDDTKPISDLQHEMMDNFTTWSKDEVTAKVNEMFGLLDALEQKFDHQY